MKDENGNYRITGRIKDMIIRGGENIYPRELEEFLYHFPGVKDVQVAAVPSKKYGEEVGAFIILHDGVTATEAVSYTHLVKTSRIRIYTHMYWIFLIRKINLSVGV